MKIEPVVNQPVVETDRFILRPVRRSDAGLIERYTGDKRVACMTSSIPHPLPPGATEAFIALCQSDKRTEDVWIMDGSGHGHAEVMGAIGLDRVDLSQVEIGYWVAPAFWNTGIASLAVNALLDANPMGSKTVFGAVFQDNPASARILTGAGFDYLGDAEAFSVARNATVPTWTYLKKLK